MLNTFSMVAMIRTLTVTGTGRADAAAQAESENKDGAKDGRQPNGPSAVLLVQYGPRREPTQRKVEFINAVNVRIPGFKFAQLQDKLKEGMTVSIQGRIQGVYRPGSDVNRVNGRTSDDRMEIELVAERVTPIDLSVPPYSQDKPVQA